ncbi:hypothetical protein [Actinomadura sp. WMMA1423]|uniref:hypothetical protein n=1 Tax=Actinomadura sp. WMMA1423 TaxID=2591108 RepID=UPI0011464A8B|nr:hypothetical protein [Actinomadura sp. WMMA1423]
MSRNSALAAIAWAAAAVTAFGSGMAAISAVGTGITEQGIKPMTSDQVAAALSVPPQPSRNASPSAPPVPPRPSPTVTVTERVTSAITNLASEAGDIVARCHHGSAYLVSWTPRQGYSVDLSRRKPPGPVFVQFRTATRRVIMTVGCHGDLPFTSVQRQRAERTGGHEESDDPYHRRSDHRD